MKSIKFLLIAVLLAGAYSASAQFTDYGTYSTTIDSISIGTTTKPAGMLDVINPSNTSIVNIGSPYTGSGSPIQNIGVIQLKNTDASFADLYYVGLRKSSLGSEAIQSVYEKSTNKWKAFSYVNVTSGKYEMRNGVTNAEFLNNGNFLINSTGSVGIGTGSTTIPSNTKLAVNGKILATEVQVALVANWADFVFNDEYNLKSLSEVEKFINENKHLPDVPSAKEVAQNGTNLGEMDAILLQKIEELTLYMIDLQNQNNILKKKLESIDNK